MAAMGSVSIPAGRCTRTYTDADWSRSQKIKGLQAYPKRAKEYG